VERHGTQSAIDLNPTNIAGFKNSVAIGIGGGQQVGYGSGAHTTGRDHALLWSGTAHSAVDLNPTTLRGIVASIAYDTDGTHQVGYGTASSDPFVDLQHAHALLWKGTAASAVDLNPTNLGGFDGAVANAVKGNQEVGTGFAGSYYNTHALLWSGTAGSATDLNPVNVPGVVTSVAYDTNGAQQVGFGGLGNGSEGDRRALLWSGSAESVVDLSQFLPLAHSSSAAYTIDDQGNIFGVATDINGIHAMEWVPVPEPAASLLGMLALVAVFVVVVPARRMRSGNGN